MSSQEICVITNVDSQVGFALAYRLLEEKRNNNRGGNNNQGTIRLLCRNKEGLDPLTQLGGEVYQVDYNAEDQVREALKSIHAVILVPEHDYQRVKYGETIIRVAKEEDVNHLCMISM
jgi:NAD(P)-dependent dehydrogenase (short-subunit alcohol dehydrogenase family)